MNLTELTDEVYTITNRPDLVGETLSAIKAATLKLHQSDFYYKDLFETGIQFDTASYTQQLEMGNVIPRFRSLKYLRRYDNSGSGAPAEFYEVLTPGELLDEYGLDKVNVAYMAGLVLNIKSYSPLEFALVGVYLNPNITTSGFSSWIATDHPYAIVYEAARVLFKMTGFDEQAAAYDKLGAEQLAMVKISGLYAVGS